LLLLLVVGGAAALMWCLAHFTLDYRRLPQFEWETKAAAVMTIEIPRLSH